MHASNKKLQIGIFFGMLAAFVSLAFFLPKLSASSLELKMKNNLISIEARDVSLFEVAKKTEKETGVKVVFATDDLKNKKVTADIKNKSIEEMFKIILGDNYVFLFVKPDNADKLVLKQVTVVNENSAEIKSSVKEISYGSKKEQVGAARGGEGANIGPKSFSVDKNGNIYVCDTVNNRIQIFSKDYDAIGTIPLEKDNIAEDVALDNQGLVYVYYNGGDLFQYNKNGDLISKIQVNESGWMARGSMHIANSKIYIKGDGAGDIAIADIKDNKLSTNGGDKQIKINGTFGASGKIYQSRLLGERGGEVAVYEGNDLKRMISFPDNILSIEFIGEDSGGNIYVEIEKNDSNKELVDEVRKFAPNGDSENTIPIPGDDYYFWSRKTLSVDEKGNIYQFMPGKDKLTLRTLNAN